MNVSNLHQAIYIHADGKTFGPYRSRYEDRITKLLHLKGIKIEYVMVPKANLLPPPRRREKKPENLTLFDMEQFTRREA